MLYGKNHAYSLTAPKGWVLDDQVWARDGIHAVFYPRGSSASGTKVADTQFFPSHPKGAEGRADADLAAFQKENPKVVIRSWPEMHTRLGMRAVIRSTSGNQFGHSEWLAYIEAPTGVIFISMNAKEPAEFDSLRGPFDELVKSCSWMADKAIGTTPN